MVSQQHPLDNYRRWLGIANPRCCRRASCLLQVALGDARPRITEEGERHVEIAPARAEDFGLVSRSRRHHEVGNAPMPPVAADCDELARVV